MKYSVRFVFFRNILLVGCIVTVSLLTLLIPFIYHYYSKITLENLRVQTIFVIEAIEIAGIDYLESYDWAERITWISKDGTVIFDNMTEANLLVNHLDRPEVQLALTNGEGSATRYSESLSYRMFYYAKSLPDGSILRLSTRQYTVFALLSTLSLPLLSLLCFGIIITFVLSSKFAKSLVKPINTINLEKPLESQTYDELSPLILHIEKQRKSLQQQLKEMEQKQQELITLTNNMNDGVLLVDNELKIVYCNQKISEIFTHLLGRNNLKLDLLEVCTNETFRHLADLLTNDSIRPKSFERNFVQDNRIYRLLATSIEQQDQFSAAVLLISDITNKEKLEAIRREFAANVSHELKTPLTSILGFAELMKEKIAPLEDFSDLAASIYLETNHLIKLVEDIILISRLDESKSRNEESKYNGEEPVSLHVLVEQAISRLKPQIEENELQVKLNLEKVIFLGSYPLLEEIVYNLCDNAIKYNKPEGKVNIIVRRNESEVILTVSDSGIGIPKQDIKRVFERFYRVDKSHEKSVGGTGLGLSIVKHAVQYHGGTIEIKSILGKGTTIKVSFPVARKLKNN